MKDDSYTEDDKKNIQEVIEDIDNALEVIGNAEEAQKLIDELPDVITKDDEAAIKAADNAYNALTDYEKALVGDETKNVLEKAKSDFAKLYFILGDADQDGRITIKDATIIQKHEARLLSLGEKALNAADVDSDGKVTVKDATTIQKYLANIPVDYHIGEERIK